MKIGLFGAGRMASDHALNIAQSGIATLSWVVDPREEEGKRLAQKHSSSYYAHWKDAVEQSPVDAFVIVSSSHTHVELIHALAPFRIPIFCEKPIALDTTEIRKAIESLESYKTPFLLGFNRRYDPHFSNLQKRLRENQLGSVQMVQITSRDHPAPPLDYLKSSGGMYHDMSIHDFDMARWLLGEEIESVFATGSALIIPELQDYNDVDTSLVVLKTKKGQIVNINNSRLAKYGYDQRIEVFGEEGMLRCENIGESNVEYFSQTSTSHDKPHHSFPQRYKEAFKLEMQHFLHDVVRDKKEAKIGYKDGLQANLIADAAKKSLKSGQFESVGK